MRINKIPKLELYSWMLSMPFILLAFHLILFDDRLWKDINIWLISFPFFTLISFFSFYGHELYGKWVENKYPALEQSLRRISLKCLVQFVVMMPSIGLIFFIYDYFNILGYTFNIKHLPLGLLVGICVNIIFETLFEADYIFEKYKESANEKENIEQLSVSQEFDTLKSQVNPHFLFNCFNTLSSLISIDKVQAEKFLNEMSKVYRYLLRNNEEGLSTVENEIKFIQSYFQLLRTRHGEAVQLNVQIDKQYEPYLLPSLTLQLLVENVVKHNVLSKNKSLLIDIFTAAGNKLVVSNNLQRRTVKAPSNGVGISNIDAKYKLLRQPGFQVMEDENNFTVVLPLMWKGTAVQKEG